TFAMHDEMAITLEDMVMRRTSIGQFGRPQPQIVESVAEQMAAELGWSEEKKVREIASLDPIFRTVS
ncbi:MAG TPA: glycerol-3-phosphate dehydrogenase C-terminal domain-containing protein, partial [Rhizomicrobium sp.]|nr:glycerol-3-phosphate dehydrogenase C-terminal domain-containing protein [Rhizomicrobium sp.]